MISIKKVLIAAALGTTLTFAGCGTTKSEEASNNTSAKATVETKTEKLSIASGSENMKNVLKDMKFQLSNKEEEKAIKTSDKLEENWSKFEDDVKAKDDKLYEKVEGPLGIIQAAVKVTPLDTKVLTSAIDNLDQVLSEVEKIK